MLFTTFSVPVFASDKGSTDGKKSTKVLKASVTITNPETGETWKWEVPESKIHRKYSKVYRSCSNVYESSSSIPVSELSSLDGEVLERQEASVDLGEYLAVAFASIIEVDETKTDDITLTAGMTYSADAANNTVSMYSAFGSTTDQGLYYADNRQFYWRNAGGIGDHKSPSTSLWSYATDSTPYTYYSSQPPYSLTEADVHVYGMGGYRTVSVKYELDDF